MVTELLERTVIQMCKDEDLTYHITPDGKVFIKIPFKGGVMPFGIEDRKVGGILTISALGNNRFPKRRVASATTKCNELNHVAPGKFTIDGDGDVRYWFDFAANETSGPSEFRPAFQLAVSTVAEYYPAVKLMLMQAHASELEAELRRQRGE